MSKKKERPDRERERPALKAQSYFHLVAMAEDYQQLLERILGADPIMQQEAGAAIAEILRAPGPNQVVGLTSAARGAAQVVWLGRMREFGADALPAIVRRLKSSQSIVNEETRHNLVERLLEALRPLGEPGGAALLGCFNSLDTYSQSIACVALGVLRVEQAADTIWDFLERVKNDEEGAYYVGALWGLVDLQHLQADMAVSVLMAQGYKFVEQYGFAARAGGPKCAGWLMVRLALTLSGGGNYDDERDDIVMALAAIAQRLGKEAFQNALREVAPNEKAIASVTNVALAPKPGVVEDYFEAYFRNPSDDLIRALTGASPA